MLLCCSHSWGDKVRRWTNSHSSPKAALARVRLKWQDCYQDSTLSTKWEFQEETLMLLSVRMEVTFSMWCFAWSQLLQDLKEKKIHPGVPCPPGETRWSRCLPLTFYKQGTASESLLLKAHSSATAHPFSAWCVPTQSPVLPGTRGLSVPGITRCWPLRILCTWTLALGPSCPLGVGFPFLWK